MGYTILYFKIATSAVIKKKETQRSTLCQRSPKRVEVGEEEKRSALEKKNKAMSMYRLGLNTQTSFIWTE